MACPKGCSQPTSGITPVNWICEATTDSQLDVVTVENFENGTVTSYPAGNTRFYKCSADNAGYEDYHYTCSQISSFNTYGSGPLLTDLNDPTAHGDCSVTDQPSVPPEEPVIDPVYQPPANVRYAGCPKGASYPAHWLPGHTTTTVTYQVASSTNMVTVQKAGDHYNVSSNDPQSTWTWNCRAKVIDSSVQGFACEYNGSSELYRDSMGNQPWTDPFDSSASCEGYPAIGGGEGPGFPGTEPPPSDPNDPFHCECKQTRGCSLQ